MAEFCKQCFIEHIMNSREQALVEQEKITFVLSENNDLCEGCGEFLPVVIQVIEE